MKSRSGKKMAIIASYFKDETYGLLGPQMAATIIQDHTPYDCIVIAVTREDDKADIKKVLAELFGVQRPVIGFSTLSGRDDLFNLAKDLRVEGAVTIQQTMYIYGLPNDILPPHSTPLIIHHASGLGDWIREIEQREGLCFKRYGSIIGWWETPQHCG